MDEIVLEKLNAITLLDANGERLLEDKNAGKVFK